MLWPGSVKTLLLDPPPAECSARCSLQMVFCSDPMIDCLLQARAQHYLEFKLLQGRYDCQQQAALKRHAQPARTCLSHGCAEHAAMASPARRRMLLCTMQITSVQAPSKHGAAASAQRVAGDACAMLMLPVVCERSYVWQQGALTAVPASRKDVFETRLSLADKRCLWRFLKSASEALQGQGPLKVSCSLAP